jgi:hypothetical protein
VVGDEWMFGGFEMIIMGWVWGYRKWFMAWSFSRAFYIGCTLFLPASGAEQHDHDFYNFLIACDISISHSLGAVLVMI